MSGSSGQAQRGKRTAPDFVSSVWYIFPPERQRQAAAYTRAGTHTHTFYRRSLKRVTEDEKGQAQKTGGEKRNGCSRI